MFDARIITGCWEDGIIELSGMPEDFILSNRTVVVAEKKEIAKLQAKVTRLEEERADWIRRHNDKAVKLQTAQVERYLLAMLASDKPKFDSPVVAAKAIAIRNRVLKVGE